MNHKALLEIGTEEIPAKQINTIHNNLLSVTEDILTAYRIGYNNINVMGAPRRLSVLIEGIAEEQEDLVEEIKGPPYNIAFDDDGQPTKAAQGFAAGQGITVEELEVKETDRGDYLFAVLEKEGQPVFELLADVYSEIITSLKFPISMRWGDYEFDFIRPLHWLLGLFDDKKIDFEVANIKSGGNSRGHRFLANKDVNISSVSEYLDSLRENYVIVDPEERKEIIINDIKSIEKDVKGNVIIDEDLLGEVIHLVEYPTVFYGSYDSKYLKMPEPVLVTPIKEHQRYFIVRNEEDNLKPNFVAVRDGAKDYIDVVRDGNEKVVKARLDDAEFYYEKDIKLTMNERVNQLKELVFVEELGTMYDKVGRIKKLVAYLGQKLKLSDKELKRAERAAVLSKADLVSHMVREFSELQGIIGREYAALEGEEPEVCKAISEHYLPRYAGDRLPETREGRLVSIADKIDTLVGSFGTGMIPTGSEDPYGLRRSAIGLVRIFKQAAIDVSMVEIIEKSYSIFNELKRDKEEVIADLMKFNLERIEYLLAGQDTDHDIIEAVIENAGGNIPRIFALADIYKQLRNEEEFSEMITAFTRIQNIAGDWSGGEIREELFEEKVEENLYKIYKDVKNKIKEAKEDKDYMLLYKNLQKLIKPVHDFFESVMIMADDENVKENRLNLLTAIYKQLLLMGDMSRIVIE